MSKKMWVYVAFGTFTAAVIALIVMGKIFHTEGEFLDGCWQADNAFQFDTRECAVGDVVEPQWGFDNLPIRVAVVDGKVEGGPVTARATRALNERLGFKLLLYVHERADIRVHWGAAYAVGEKSPAGSCGFVREEGRGYRGSIFIRGQHSVGAEARIIQHELGHCGLMLAHDDFDSSLMARVQKNVDTPGFHGRLTDHDVEIIRKRYRRD